MIDLSTLYEAIPHILPVECMRVTFMQRALVGLLLLSPMCALMGVQMVNFRMAFFSDAISHSAFAGVALGLLLGIDPRWTMPLFGLLVGLGIVMAGRRASLSSDTVIGVFFSATVAFGIAMISRDRTLSRDVQRFLFGDILTLGDSDLLWLFLLLVGVMGFQGLGYNRMLYVGIHPGLAAVHQVKVKAYQLIFAGLLSILVIFSVWVVGVFLVTAMLIIPAAAGRNLARSAGGMAWWALVISLSSSVAGLVISGQPWARTATGSTIVLCATFWFVASMVAGKWRKG